MYYFNVFQRISERRNDDAVLLIVSRWLCSIERHPCCSCYIRVRKPSNFKKYRSWTSWGNWSVQADWKPSRGDVQYEQRAIAGWDGSGISHPWNMSFCFLEKAGRWLSASSMGDCIFIIPRCVNNIDRPGFSKGRGWRSHDDGAASEWSRCHFAALWGMDRSWPLQMGWSWSPARQPTKRRGS